MKQIPIGIENFKELIDKDYYYVPGHADSVKP